MRAILTDFTHRHPDVFHGEMRDGVAAIASVQTCEAERLARNCQARIELLAGLRQRVFDMAMKHSDWDAVVMLDLDFVYFTHQDFLQTFAVGMRLTPLPSLARACIETISSIAYSTTRILRGRGLVGTKRISAARA